MGEYRGGDGVETAEKDHLLIQGEQGGQVYILNHDRLGGWPSGSWSYSRTT